MATDLERLIVSLEASFTKYERAWQRAQGLTDANTKQLGQKFDRTAVVVSNAGQNTARALTPVSLQTSNIAAQFQDIAVQLQSGQSPFTIALQQGTQLSAALGAGGGGLKGALAGLAAGFGSLVNPVSLATIAVIALGGAAVQYFGTLINDGRVSAEELKKQEDLIRKVADRWGDAVPELRAYVDQLDRAREVTERVSAANAQAARTFQPVREQTTTMAAGLADVIVQLQAVGGQETLINDLQAAFANLSAKVREQTATAEDAKAVQDLLANAFEAVGLPALERYAAGFGDLARAIRVASAEAGAFLREAGSALSRDSVARRGAGQASAFVLEQQRLNSLTAEQLALETEIARVKSEAERDDVVLSEQQALEIAQQRLAAEERRAEIKAGSKSAGAAADEAAREAEAVLHLIAELEHEYELLRLTDQEREVANALRRAGAAATDEQRTRIEELVNATYEERQQIEALNGLYGQFGQVGKTAVMGIVEALRDGKVEAAELGDILSNVLGQLGQFFLNQAFGGGGGNIFSTLFGGIGRNADGTQNWRGGLTWVGERGPELVNLPRGSQVFSASRSASMAGGQTNVFHIDARGAEIGVEQKIVQAIRTMVPPMIRSQAPAATASAQRNRTYG